MKKILVIPKDITGVIDVRKTDYMIFNDMSTVEQIVTQITASGGQHSVFKFSQFEPNEDIPIFLKVKDRISGGPMVEFEIEKVKFSDIDSEDVEDLVKERFLAKLNQEKLIIGNKVIDLMVEEKLTGKITEDDYKSLKTEYTKVNKQINGFDYKKHLDELV